MIAPALRHPAAPHTTLSTEAPQNFIGASLPRRVYEVQ